MIIDFSPKSMHITLIYTIQSLRIKQKNERKKSIFK